jgi:LysR family glycine cleavage system transcriptional activator
MRSKLPSLNSLKVFEAVARHLSFTKAAAELYVTQAAASHQVKILEEQLGVALFFRHPRRIQLTSEGKILLPVMTKSLDAIAGGVEKITSDRGLGMLRVRLGPSISAKWLSPKLGDFWHHNPGINLSLFHSNEEVDFSREDIDIAMATAAFREALSDTSQLTMEQCQQVYMTFNERKTENLAEEGVAFLQENASKEGVETTESGLQYKILHAGTGEYTTAESTVTVH